MESVVDVANGSKGKLWTGRILSGLTALFLLFDSSVKVMKSAIAVEARTRLGFPEGTVVPIGVVLLICVVTYAVRRTSIVGAILLTGYLGGAVAAQVRVGNALFSNILFPVYVGALVWAGLVLRDVRVQSLFRVRS